MKNLITIVLFLFFHLITVKGQFLTVDVESLVIEVTSFKDSISITAGNKFIKGFGNLKNPSIVDLKQDSLHFCFMLKTTGRNYDYYYLFAGIKKIAEKKIVLDYEKLQLTMEFSMGCLIIIEPVIIIDPITFLVKHEVYPKGSLKEKKTDKDMISLFRIHAGGMDEYQYYGTRRRFFYNNYKVRTNEN